MATSFSLEGEQQWFADSGATTHVTNDMQNLSLRSDYKGKEKITVGKGQALFISSIGSSIAHTSFGSCKLNNVLHVPYISSNLLFVQ